VAWGLILIIASSCSRVPTRVARVDRTSSDATGAQPSRRSSTEFRVVTYNAGLAIGVVKFASERVEPAIGALLDLKADLLCLQEFWLEEHWRQLAVEAAASLPHIVRVSPLPIESVAPTSAAGGGVGDAPCSREEIGPVADCARRNCPNLSSDRLASCAVQHCRSLARGISSACAACITSDPVGTVDSILEPCIGSKAALPRGSISPTEIVPYGGSYGIGVLTRETILAQDVLRLEGDLNPRAVIYTRLRTAAVGEVDAFCTHLTPNTSDLAPTRGRSWAEVHAGQVNALLAWINEKADRARPILLLGDFNSGPAIVPNIAGRFPEDYERVAARGFVNAYLTPRVQCTFCDANPLNEGIGNDGTVIDHILTKGFAGQVDIERVLVDDVDLRVASKTVRGAYSDHYGLMATMRETSR
jgi:endonuclease/exonuclease/phosphatase family metal-dependent hydrolase